MNKIEDESNAENKNAIDSFFQRGWGFVRYDENGLHFLEADFGLFKNIESKA